MLKFLGIGSCFNVTMGNTSAYYIDKYNKSMLLIDCGESVFADLVKKELLKDLEKFTVVITHLHSDHVGSLPSLIFYLGIVYGLKPNIVYPDKREIIEKTLFSVDKDYYNIYTPEEYSINICDYLITEIKQKHSNKISAYGYEIVIDNKKIYYSGDTHTLSKEILSKFLNNEYTSFYHEVTKYENESHYHISKLIKDIPKERRKDVTCMHIDDEELLKLAKDEGFKIADV